MTITRTYERTHPWLKFKFDLGSLPHQLWIVLGEIQAKCEQIANTPLRPATANELHRLYLAKGALATTAIEGNTLSEEEARAHIEGRLELPPSKEYLGKEIWNIVDACDLIASRAVIGTYGDLNLKIIKEYNKMVLEGLDVMGGVVPGEVRTHAVGVAVARYRGAPAEECEYLLEQMCRWLNTGFGDQDGHLSIAYGLIKAIIAHIYIAWIHPFGDGNGRTVRLVEFQLLLESGVPTPAPHLLSNFYNETRTEYYRQLDKTSKSGGNLMPFIEYAVRGFLDGLNSQLEVIGVQQLNVAWVNYIHDKFKNRSGVHEVRRRHLALDLSLRRERIKIVEIPNVSPRMAVHYAEKTSRTIVRDVSALVEMGILKVSEEGVEPNREKILAFLPPRRRSNQTAD